MSEDKNDKGLRENNRHRGLMASKKFLVLRVIAYALVGVALVLWMTYGRRSGAFAQCVEYWASISGGGVAAYDPAIAARNLAPLLNEGGIEFLARKATEGKGEEMAVAVASLDTILDAARNTPQRDPAAVARILRPLKSMDMDALNAKALSVTTNEALRQMLGYYMAKPKGDSPAATNEVEAVVQGEVVSNTGSIH